MICEQGDVISLNFNPSQRHEPAGRHYAVVVSPWHVNRMSALTVVVPVTSTNNGYPLHVPISVGNPIEGYVQCEAIRAVDLGIRERQGRAEVVGSLDDATLAKVLSCILVVLGVEQL